MKWVHVCETGALKEIWLNLISLDRSSMDILGVGISFLVAICEKVLCRKIAFGYEIPHLIMINLEARQVLYLSTHTKICLLQNESLYWKLKGMKLSHSYYSPTYFDKWMINSPDFTTERSETLWNNLPRSF